MYETLWRSKSHLFAVAVTCLAYSHYSADYNYTEEFAVLYNDKELAFYLPVSTVKKRVERAQVFFSQTANLNLYLTECQALEAAYKAFYYSLEDDLSQKSNAELASLFSAMLHLQARCASLYQGTNEYGTKYLHDKLVTEVKKHTENWQQAMIEVSVETPIEIIKEEEDYAQLFSSQNPNLLIHIKKHPWVCGKAFLFEEAVSELRELMKTRRPRQAKAEKNEFQHLLKNPEIAELASKLRTFSALRITLKCLLQHKLLASPLFEEIGKRMQVEPGQLVYTFDAFEILNWLESETNTPPKVVSGARLYKNRGTTVEFLGEKSAVEFAKFLKNEGETKELSGLPVCRGKASGIAQIILPNRLSEMSSTPFNDGDILVTTMTNPNMIFLASKAAAIVTDEGGITCHAAIISRELKKPCIVGTRKATTTFKDGDLVEIDAEKGIVKIISTQ